MDSKNIIFGNVSYTKTCPDEEYVDIQVNWTIPKIMEFINKEKSNEIRSPFSKETSPDDWKFQLKIKHLKSDNKIDIFYLSPTQVLLKSVTLKKIVNSVYGNNTYSVLGINGEKHIHECRIVEANTWYFLKQLPIADLELLQTFKYEFTIKKDLKIPGAQLINDMENLFLEGIYTDVIIKSSDDKEFRVHKAVLVCRSAVFKALYGLNTTKGNNNSNIVESPFESAVLHQVLSFIYTDKAPKVHEIPEKLLAAADYYQLNGLKNLCADALQMKLTFDNAIETLQLAELYSVNALELFVLKFISQDTQKLITNTESWEKLESIDMLKKIFEYCK